MLKRVLPSLLGLTLGFVLSGCGADLMSAPAYSGEMGGAGANAGGAQDIGLARKKIAEGVVPAPEDFPAEGLYAEHDLPIPGEPCHEAFCLRGATARVPNVSTGDVEVFVQMGMASNVDLSTFRRRPLNVALVIDHSGSMEGGKMQAVRDAAKRLVDRLDEGDILSIVKFDDASRDVLLPVAVSDRSMIKEQIETIEVDGGTCIECGLRRGYQLLAQHHDPSRESRILLFTDALPNVGATGEGEFTQLVNANASDGMHLTAFGVGIDFGQELVTKLSAIRGANYVFLADDERTRTVFDEDFDFLVTPIAFDLHFSAEAGEGLALAAGYGIPGVSPEEAQVGMTVKTVFLSRRRSAIVLRLSGVSADSAVAELSLAWTGVDGNTRTSTLSLQDPPGDAPAYSAPEVRKTVALTQLIIGARAACTAHQQGDATKASEIAERTAQLLDAEATALEDPALRKEADLARALADLLAPQ